MPRSALRMRSLPSRCWTRASRSSAWRRCRRWAASRGRGPSGCAAVLGDAVALAVGVDQLDAFVPKRGLQWVLRTSAKALGDRACVGRTRSTAICAAAEFGRGGPRSAPARPARPVSGRPAGGVARSVGSRLAVMLAFEASEAGDGRRWRSSRRQSQPRVGALRRPRSAAEGSESLSALAEARAARRRRDVPARPAAWRDRLAPSLRPACAPRPRPPHTPPPPARRRRAARGRRRRSRGSPVPSSGSVSSEAATP